MNENHKSIFEKALENINHPLSSHLDENVKIMFKGFGKEATEFQTKLKKFGFDKEYRKMMQNFKKNANPGDGLFFIEEIPSDDERKRTNIGDRMELEVLPVDGNYYNLKKLGDSYEQKRGGTVYKARLIAIKEGVQLGEEAPPGGNPPQYLWELILIPLTIQAAEGTLGVPGQYYAAYDYNGDGVNDYADVDAAIEIYLSGIAPMTAPAYFAFMAKLDAANQENRLEKGGAQIQIGTELGSNTAKAPTPPPDTGVRESILREERAMTYVIDRKTKKIVHGPTDTGDAKLYLKKQIQPGKFMIRQIRGAAKKVGDSV